MAMPAAVARVPSIPERPRLAKTTAAGSGVTVLFVEHDMDIVSRYAHRVIAFYDGRVIADGSPESVLASESVRRYVIGEKIEHAAA